jgi:hypothetical protein
MGDMRSRSWPTQSQHRLLAKKSPAGLGRGFPRGRCLRQLALLKAGGSHRAGGGTPAEQALARKLTDRMKGSVLTKRKAPPAPARLH